MTGLMLKWGDMSGITPCMYVQFAKSVQAREHARAPGLHRRVCCAWDGDLKEDVGTGVEGQLESE